MSGSLRRLVENKAPCSFGVFMKETKLSVTPGKPRKGRDGGGKGGLRSRLADLGGASRG